MGRFEIKTALAVDADELWEQAVTFEGVNYELGPVLKMTMPPGARGGRTIADMAPGERLGRSWLLLGGVLPVDYDDIGIAELGPRRFQERSRMLSMSIWEHERVVEAAGERSCTVTDRLGFTLRGPLGRIGAADSLATLMIGATFRHRHRRLVRRHGPG